MGLEKCLPLPYIRAHIRRIGTPISPSPGKVAQAWGWQPKCPVLAFTATPPTAKSLIYSCNPCTRESQTSRMGWHIPAEIKQARTLSWSKDLAWSPLFTAGSVSGFKGMTTLRLQLKTWQSSLPHQAEHATSCLQVKAVRIRTGSAFVRIPLHLHHSETILQNLHWCNLL